MGRPSHKLQRFFRELKRRNVYQVAATYAVVGFVLIQVADLTFVRLGLPPWTVTFLIVLVAMGFPLAVVLAWAFERTPEGVRRTAEAEPVKGEAGEGEAGTRIAYKLLVGLGLAAAAVVGGWYLTGGSGSSQPEVTDRSIAILPFDSTGGQESGFLSEGISDGLQTRLASVSDLTVISSHSAGSFGDTDLPIPEIARELDVAWIVTGEVRQAGDQVRIGAHLVDARADREEWAKTFTRKIESTTDIFSIESELASEIAGELEAEIGTEERARIAREPTESLAAYRMYARGRDLLSRRTPPAIDSARDYFRRAIEQDTAFALAWVGLADARVLYPAYGGGEGREGFDASVRNVIPEAKAAARTALRLDPDLGEAHASLGLINYLENMVDPEAGSGPRAFRHLRRAVELKSGYAQSQHWLGNVLMRIGRPELALAHLELGVELNPNHVAAHRNLTYSLISNGRYGEALTNARRFREMYPRRDAGPALEAAALLHLGRWEELRSLTGQYLSGKGEVRSWPLTYHAIADAATGETAAARAQLARLRAEDGDWRHFAIALVEAALGNEAAALSALADIVHPFEWIAVRSGPQELRYWYPKFLDPIRDEPRFQEVVAKVNERWGLNPDGSLSDSVDVSFGSETAD